METKQKTLAECKEIIVKNLLEWGWSLHVSKDNGECGEYSKLSNEQAKDIADAIIFDFEHKKSTAELYTGQTKQSDNFCPAGLPENDLVEKIVSIMYAHKTDESDEGVWISSEDFYKVAGYISTALKQPKQLERTHCDENPVEFMRGKINEYFHDWRKSHTDSTIIEIDGLTLGEITFKAEQDTKKKFPWIRYKQSNPVSVDDKSDYFFYYFPNHGDEDGKNCWTVCYGNEESDGDEIILTTEDEEDAQDLCRRLNKIISEQPEQPVSFSFLSEEEIKSHIYPAINGLYGTDCEKAFILGADKIQSELRKRVIDPVELLDWIKTFDSLNRQNGEWVIESQLSSRQVINCYIATKTK